MSLESRYIINDSLLHYRSEVTTEYILFKHYIFYQVVLSQAQYSRVILASYCAVMKTICTYTYLTYVDPHMVDEEQTIALDCRMFLVFVQTGKALFVDL